VIRPLGIAGRKRYNVRVRTKTHEPAPPAVLRWATRRKAGAPRWAIWLGAAAIAAAAIAAYADSFAGQFVIDDHIQIVTSARVRSLGPAREIVHDENNDVVYGPDGRAKLRWAWPALQNPRPVVTMSLAANYVGGKWAHDKLGWGTGPLDVRAYHAVNLAVHLLAALVLFGVVRRTLRRRGLRRHVGRAGTAIALATALIWVVHPLNTGAVTYVIQRAESMMGLFYLLAVYSAIRAFSRRGRRSVLWCVLACLSAAAGAGCKEVIATVPLIVLVYDRVFVARSFRRLLRRRWAMHAALAAVTWGLIVLRMVLRPPAHSAGFKGAGLGAKLSESWEYLATQFGVVAHYLRLSFWPAGLNIDYWWPAAGTFGEVFWPGLLIGALVAATVAALWRRPALGFAGLWVFLILAPSSSILPIRDRAFEHRMYLSLAGLICVTVVGVWLGGRWFLRRVTGSPKRRAWAGAAIASAAALAVAAALGIATFRRNAVYADVAVLYQDVVDKAPLNPRGHRNLGVAMVRKGDLQRARWHLKRSLDLYPQSPIAHSNYGAVLDRLGDLRGAIREYRIALELEPAYLDAACNLGTALRRAGDNPGAMKVLRSVLRKAPWRSPPYVEIGLIELSLAQRATALRYFEKAVMLDPDNGEALYNAGVLQVERGERAEGIANLRKAVALAPKRPDARHALGRALWTDRRPAEALSIFRSVLGIDPGHRPARRAIAEILATYPDPAVRNGAEAVRIAEQLCRETGYRQIPHLGALAAAYAEAGRFDRAAQVARHAVLIAHRQGATETVRQLQQQIAAYQAGRPVRFIPGERPSGG